MMDDVDFLADLTLTLGTANSGLFDCLEFVKLDDEDQGKVKEELGRSIWELVLRSQMADFGGGLLSNGDGVIVFAD